MNADNNIPGKLNQIPKENPFKTPDGYFGDFASRMAETIAKEKPKPEHKVIQMARQHWVTTAAAACVLLAALAGGGYVLTTTPAPKQFSEAELVKGYETSLMNEMSEDELINQLEKLKKTTAAKDTSNEKNDYSKAAADFLSDENVDLQSVVDQL